MHDVTLTAYSCLVLLVTLWPAPPDPAHVPLVQRLLDRLHGIGVPAAFDLAALELWANVAMFVPLGALLAAWRRLPRSPWLAVPAGLAFSATIETIQLLLPQRYPSLQDVGANTLGTAIGTAAVVAVVAVVAAARARPARRPRQGARARSR